MKALIEFAAREQEQPEPLDPDGERAAWARMIKKRGEFVPAVEDLWAYWDYLRGDVRGRVVAADRRWIDPEAAAELDHLRSGNDWTSLSGDGYRPGAAEAILDVIRITRQIAVELNVGDPLNFNSFSNGRIPPLEELVTVLVHPDI